MSQGKWAPNSYCHFHKHLGNTLSLVFFSMQAVGGKLFEVLGRAERVLNVTALDDFLAGNMPR
jgi:hypothetical protein